MEKRLDTAPAKIIHKIRIVGSMSNVAYFLSARGADPPTLTELIRHLGGNPEQKTVEKSLLINAAITDGKRRVET